MSDSTSRFSSRVENYIRFRPGYPREVIDALVDKIHLAPEAKVADLGSGTGISARLFLEFGNTVYGVEPNAAMRAAGEEFLRDCPAFRSVDGTAEATTLLSTSIDLVVAAQAFHWFDVPKVRVEIFRILKPTGHVALIWNRRRLAGTPFLEGYEQLLQSYGTDYQSVNEKHADPQRLSEFFGPAGYQKVSLPSYQHLDWEELQGRLMSSSYVPLEGQPGHAGMLRDLQQLFENTAENGKVTIAYDTELFVGQ